MVLEDLCEGGTTGGLSGPTVPHESVQGVMATLGLGQLVATVHLGLNLTEKIYGFKIWHWKMAVRNRRRRVGNGSLEQES